MKKTILIGLLLFGSNLFAQQVTIDLNKIDPELAKQIIQSQQTGVSHITPTEANKWISIGVAVGEVIKTTAKTINVETNFFAKSDLGRQVMWLVFYEYVGKGWLRAGVLFLLFLICLPITIYAFVNKNDNLKGDARTAFQACFVVLQIITLTGVFIGIGNI